MICLPLVAMQYSKSSETTVITSEIGVGPPQKIPEPSTSAPEEEEDNLSDTDSKSEGIHLHGPVIIIKIDPSMYDHTEW